MKKYKSIFFDLDHTLWDFDRNSYETISELYDLHELEQAGVSSLQDFMNVYLNINQTMWDEYHKNVINKETLRAGRFARTLNFFGVDNNVLTEKLASQYLDVCPHKTHLFPEAIEVLDYLSAKYNLHIITNGFKEVQYTKIRNSGIDKYFDKIHISEEIGFKKPDREIFNYAVRQAETIHEHCIMIGDNPETDIMGALNSGIDHILFNPHGAVVPNYVHRKVQTLKELILIL